MTEETSYRERLRMKDLKNLSLPSLTGILRQESGEADVGEIIKEGITVPVDHVLELAPIGEEHVEYAFVLICKQRPLQLWLMTQPPTTLPRYEDVEMAALALLIPKEVTPEYVHDQLENTANLQWLCHPKWDNQHAGNPSVVGAGTESPADLLSHCEKLDEQIRELMEKVELTKAKELQVKEEIAAARGNAATWENWALPNNAIPFSELELDDLNGNLSVIAYEYPLEEQLPIHPDIFKLWMIDRWMANSERSPGPPSTEDLLAAFDTCWREAREMGVGREDQPDTHHLAADELQALKDALLTPIGNSMEAKLMQLPGESKDLREQAQAIVDTPNKSTLNTPEGRRKFCEHLSHDLSQVTLF